MLVSVLGGCHVPGKALKFLQWQNTVRKTLDGRQTEHVPKTETECPSWAKGKRTDKQNSADSTVCAGRAQQTVGITGEWLAAAVCWRERKVQWVGCTRGGGRSGIGKRDIANKGDIVWDADDSRAAAQPESACDTSSLKPSPALSSSDLFCSPSTPLSSSSFQTEERVALLYFFPSGPDGSVRIRFLFCPLSPLASVRMSLPFPSSCSVGDVVIRVECTFSYAP